jgi:hypothetical protein
MSSFGENDLLVNSRVVGRIRVLEVHAGSALFHRLILRLGVVLQETAEAEFESGRPVKGFEMRDLMGQLQLEENALTVGRLEWLGPRRNVRSSGHFSENQVEAICDLDTVRLEGLESRRAGREPIFWLALWPTLVDSQGFLNCDIRPIRAAIPRDNWVSLLSSFRNSRIDVLEIRRPELASPDFDAAVGHLREARTRVDRGDYDEAVAACRRAIESVTAVLNLGQKATDIETALDAVTDEKRAKAYAGIVARLKELAGHTIHRSHAPGRYVRAEAQFIIGTTEYSIALLAQLLYSA